MNAGPELRDIHLPAEPGLWPPAPGQWLLALLALLALAWLIRRGWRAYRRRLQHRRWLRVLSEINADPARSPGERVAAASELLRRAAREVRPQAAALVGQDWINFLAGLGGEADRQGLRILAEAPFRPQLDSAQAEQALRSASERLPWLLERLS
jgi:hypothetical protein